MASSVNTQQKFSGLRKRLDQLGYKQPLGIESLPLVERLLADLIHTTDSLKKAKLEKSTAPTVDKPGVPQEVEAYRSDNAKLIKEANELHQEIIKQKELAATSIRGES
jgi:centrosomal protein CEP135